MPPRALHELRGDDLTWALDERNQRHWRKLERNQYLTWVLFGALFGGTGLVMRFFGLG